MQTIGRGLGCLVEACRWRRVITTAAPQLRYPVDLDAKGRFPVAAEGGLKVSRRGEVDACLSGVAPEPITKLHFSSPASDRFQDERPVRASAQDHAQDFQDPIFPEIISLAADIVDYGRRKAPAFYGALADLLGAVDKPEPVSLKAGSQIWAILENLANDAQGRALSAAAAISSTRACLARAPQDERFLKSLRTLGADGAEGLATLNAALAVLGEAKGAWSALAADILRVGASLTNPQGPDPRLSSSLNLETAISRWKRIADEAEHYHLGVSIAPVNHFEIPKGRRRRASQLAA